ncbi:MAG: nuclease [Brevundimonas sp.]|nr:MAG: nuclease [Brevundimonas sp.]
MRGWILSGLILTTCASPVLADPCSRIPDRGSMPADLTRGRSFVGQVVYVGDGDSLCVAVGPRRGLDWVEVRLGDFNAPELHETGGAGARDALARFMGLTVDCVADHRSYDRVVARCTYRGRGLGDLLRQAGGVEGGR